MRSKARTWGTGRLRQKPGVSGRRRVYFFFLAAFLLLAGVDFFDDLAFFDAFALAGFFFVALAFTAPFLVDLLAGFLAVVFFLETDFFFEVDFFFDFFTALALLVFFFLADLPNAVVQPSEYFSLVPIRKIVMIFSSGSIQFLCQYQSANPDFVTGTCRQRVFV